jgi:hypothetical protein
LDLNFRVADPSWFSEVRRLWSISCQMECALTSTGLLMEGLGLPPAITLVVRADISTGDRTFVVGFGERVC